jgi:hypothetical protein
MAEPAVVFRSGDFLRAAPYLFGHVIASRPVSLPKTKPAHTH